MTALIGLNVRGDGSSPLARLQDLGVQIVRMVLYPHIDLTDTILAYHAAGIIPLLLVARESHGGEMPDEFDSSIAQKYAALYAARYGHLGVSVWWQWGNESDHVSPSSWTLPAHVLTMGLAIMRIELGPAAYIVSAGMADGRPEYLDEVDLSPCNAIGLHLYGQRPNEHEDWSELPGNFGSMGAKIDEYRRFGLPFVMSEIGINTAEASEAFQARYIGSTITALKPRTDMVAVTIFCETDQMVPKFGITRAGGQQKPAYQAFKVAASNPIPAPPSYGYVLGFKDIHDRHPSLVGSPSENEFGPAIGMSLQRSSNGVLYWADLKSGQVMGFLDDTDGRRYVWNGSTLVEVAA